MKKGIIKAGWLLVYLAAFMLFAAPSTITKRQIEKEDHDLTQTDGVTNETVSVPTSTGGTMTVHKPHGGMFPWDNSYSRTIRPGAVVDNTNILKFIPTALHAGIAARTDNTDLTAYVQAAITSMNSTNPGAALTFPAGTYNVSSTLNTAHVEVRILGDHRDTTVIKFNGTGTLFHVGALFFSAENITFLGDGTSDQTGIDVVDDAYQYYEVFSLREVGIINFFTKGVKLEKTAGTYFENVNIQGIKAGATGIGLDLDGTTSGNWINANQFVNVNISGMGIGLKLRGGVSNKFSVCTFQGNAIYGVDIEGGGYSNVFDTCYWEGNDVMELHRDVAVTQGYQYQLKFKSCYFLPVKQIGYLNRASVTFDGCTITVPVGYTGTNQFSVVFGNGVSPTIRNCPLFAFKTSTGLPLMMGPQDGYKENWLRYSDNIVNAAWGAPTSGMTRAETAADGTKFLDGSSVMTLIIDNSVIGASTAQDIVYLGTDNVQAFVGNRLIGFRCFAKTSTEAIMFGMQFNELTPVSPFPGSETILQAIGTSWTEVRGAVTLPDYSGAVGLQAMLSATHLRTTTTDNPATMTIYIKDLQVWMDSIEPPKRARTEILHQPRKADPLLTDNSAALTGTFLPGDFAKRRFAYNTAWDNVVGYYATAYGGQAPARDNTATYTYGDQVKSGGKYLYALNGGTSGGTDPDVAALAITKTVLDGDIVWLVVATTDAVFQDHSVEIP